MIVFVKMTIKDARGATKPKFEKINNILRVSGNHDM